MSMLHTSKSLLATLSFKQADFVTFHVITTSPRLEIASQQVCTVTYMKVKEAMFMIISHVQTSKVYACILGPQSFSMFTLLKASAVKIGPSKSLH